MAVSVSHWWAQPGFWRFFPGLFCGGLLLGRVLRHGRTKADAIKPKGFKVQAVEQIRDISSCGLKLLYVDHKYFQAYVYSMNQYSGAWWGNRLFSLVSIWLASLLKMAVMPAERLRCGPVLLRAAAFEMGRKKEVLATVHQSHPSGFPYSEAFFNRLEFDSFFYLFCQFQL